MDDYEYRLVASVVVMFCLYQLTRMYMRLYQYSETTERFAEEVWAENIALRKQVKDGFSRPND